MYLLLCCFMHQVRIHQFLEKTKKKKVDKNTKRDGDGSSSALEEQVKLQKKVTDLMKKQKLHAVNKIVNKQDESKPWSQDARAKVKMFSETISRNDFSPHLYCLHKGSIHLVLFRLGAV